MPRGAIPGNAPIREPVQPPPGSSTPIGAGGNSGSRQVEQQLNSNQPSNQDMFNMAIMIQLGRIYDLLLTLLPDNKANKLLEMHTDGHSFCPPPAIAQEEVDNERNERDSATN